MIDGGGSNEDSEKWFCLPGRRRLPFATGIAPPIGRTYNVYWTVQRQGSMSPEIQRERERERERERPIVIGRERNSDKDKEGDSERQRGIGRGREIYTPHLTILNIKEKNAILCVTACH